MDEEPYGIPSPGHLTMSDAQWEQTRLRAEVIGNLAERDHVGVAAADEAAVELGISRRQVYVLLERYRQGSGLVTDDETHVKGPDAAARASDEDVRVLTV